MSKPAEIATKRQTLSDVRTMLVALFDDVKQIKMIAEDAQLTMAHIDFAGPPIQVWWSVLQQAAAEGKIGQVVAAAAAHYPEERERLEAAAQRYATALPDPPDRRRWMVAGIIGGVVLVLAGILLLLKPWEPRIEPMSPLGAFNLAVAQFPVVDTAGRKRQSCVSDLASTWIYDAVRQPSSAPSAQTISDLRGPAEIGALSEEKVAALSEEINATIIIYGVITATETSYTLQPAFHVRDTGSRFGYGSEVAGVNRLGEAVEFVLPPDVDCDAITGQQLGTINRQLRDRLAALRFIVAGLGYYFEEEYAQAAYWFEQAGGLTEWPADAPGQEVVQLLQGAAWLRAPSLADPVLQMENLRKAEDAFHRAVLINPAYSRGYLGLGSVALERAKIYDQQGVNVIDIAPAQLVKASEAYTSAFAATDQPPSAYVKPKVALGIGSAHVLGLGAGLAGWSEAAAIAQLSSVTLTVESDAAPALAHVGALAYGYLGKLAALKADWQPMKRHCERMIQLLEQPEVQPDARSLAEAWGCVAIADEQLEDACAAIDDYQKARQWGDQVIAPAKLALWQAEQERLRPMCNQESSQS